MASQWQAKDFTIGGKVYTVPYLGDRAPTQEEAETQVRETQTGGDRTAEAVAMGQLLDPAFAQRYGELSGTKAQGYIPSVLPPKQVGAQMISGGAAALAAAPAMIFPPSAPAQPLLQSGAQYGARKLNVALGLEEPGMLGDVAAAAVPVAIPAAGALLRRLVPYLPGASAAMHEQGANVARAIHEQIKPPLPSGPLYQQVEQFNPMIPTPRISQKAARIGQEQAQLFGGLESPAIKGTAKGIAVETTAVPAQAVPPKASSILDPFGNPIMIPQPSIPAKAGDVSFQVLRENLKALGARVRAAATTGGEDYGNLRQLWKAGMEDLEAAAAAGGPANPAMALLKEANAAARKEFAADDLKTIIEDAITKRNDGLEVIHTGRMITRFEKELRNDDVFRGSFSAQELESLHDRLKQLTKIPRIPPEGGAQFGSGQSAVRAGVGFAASTLMGASPQTASAVAGGAAASAVLLSKALMTEPGRVLVSKLLESGPILSPQKMGLLTSFLRTTGQLIGEQVPARTIDPRGYGSAPKLQLIGEQVPARTIDPLIGYASALKLQLIGEQVPARTIDPRGYGSALKLQ